MLDFIQFVMHTRIYIYRIMITGIYITVACFHNIDLKLSILVTSWYP